MSKKQEEKSTIEVKKDEGVNLPRKAEFKALLDAYKEQSPVKWELKKEALLKKLESLPE